MQSGYIIVYVLEMAVLYCRHFRNCLLEILKWKFEDRFVHISFFQFLYICYVSLLIIMIGQMYVRQLCVIIIVLAVVHNFDFVFCNYIRFSFENTVYDVCEDSR